MDSFLYWYTSTALKLEPQSGLFIWSDILISGIIAMVLLGLVFTVMSEEKWAKYLGIVIAFEAVVSLLELFGFKHLVLANARILVPFFLIVVALDLDPGLRYQRPNLTLGRKVKSVLYVPWMFGSLIIFSSALGFAFIESNHYAPFHRFPLALCIMILSARIGYALRRNMSVRPKGKAKKASRLAKWWGYGGVIVCLTWALNPWITVNHYGFTAKAWLHQDVTQFPLLHSLDRFLLIGVIAAKFNVLIFALFLLIRSLGIMLSSRKILEGESEWNREVFDPHCRHGLLDVVGSDLGAHFLSLNILYPGTRETITWTWFQENYFEECTKYQVDFSAKKTLRQKWIELLRNIKQIFGKRSKQIVRKDPLEEFKHIKVSEEFCPKGYHLHLQVSNPMKLSIPGSSDMEHSFHSGDMIQSEEIVDPPFNKTTLVPGIKSYVSTPILFQNEVIANIKFENRARGCFTPLIVRLSRRYARVLAPIVHGRREAYAMDILSEKLGVLGKKGHSPEQFLIQACKEIHHVLSPVATCISMNIGFKRYLVGIGPDKQSQVIPLQADTSDPSKTLVMMLDGFSIKDKDHRLIMETLTFPGVIENQDESSADQCELETREATLDPKKPAIQLGMLLFVYHEHGKRNAPTLVRGSFLRRSVATLLVSAYLSGNWQFLTRRLVHLQRRLSKTKLTSEAWLRQLRRTAKKAGIILLGGSSLEKGSHIPIELGLDQHGRLMNTPLESLWRTGLEAGELKPPFKGAHCLVKITFEQGHVLWLGLPFKDIKADFAFQQSPWKMFLNSFKEVAGRLLQDMTMTQMRQMVSNLKLQSQRGVIKNLWLHELGNAINRIELSNNRALELLYAKEYSKAYEKLVKAVSFSDRFSQIVQKLNSPMGFDDERVNYSISEVIDSVHSYYQILLDSKDISFEARGDLSARIGLFFAFTYLGISNLFANAIKVMKGRGEKKILIEVVEDENHILCHVQDTGPGVPVGFEEKIFEPGFTTKEKHSGFGLGATRKLLEASGAKLLLDTTYKDGARFSLVLPKEIQAEEEHDADALSDRRR